MELSQCLTCPCNGKVYSSNASLKSHHKTNLHIFYESQKEQKETIIKINRLENEVGHLRRLNNLLMERITELKS